MENTNLCCVFFQVHVCVASDLHEDLLVASAPHKQSCPFELCSLVTLGQFREHFMITKPIGGGGQSSVFHVTNLTVDNPCALVVTPISIDLERPKYWENTIQALINNQEINPHQAKIYGYFWIEVPELFASATNLMKETYPQSPRKDGENNEKYYHEATLMELGIGDLESKAYGGISFDKNIEHLMFLLNKYSMEKALIGTTDEKLRNYIFVKTAGQKYRGNDMSAYDFWRYKLGDLDVYIPTPSHIIKRIDYGGFKVRNGIPTTPTLDMVERFCQKPSDPNATILDIELWDAPPIVNRFTGWLDHLLLHLAGIRLPAFSTF